LCEAVIQCKDILIFKYIVYFNAVYFITVSKLCHRNWWYELKCKLTNNVILLLCCYWMNWIHDVDLCWRSCLCWWVLSLWKVLMLINLYRGVWNVQKLFCPKIYRMIGEIWVFLYFIDWTESISKVLKYVSFLRHFFMHLRDILFHDDKIAVNELFKFKLIFQNMNDKFRMYWCLFLRVDAFAMLRCFVYFFHYIRLLFLCVVFIVWRIAWYLLIWFWLFWYNIIFFISPVLVTLHRA
jgi:hypothetical protein